ncbi:MAG: hypothetical protein IKY33_01310 [Clostridia bacterium]|nr:hypothetical protein [Clostridia bacterium]
MQLLYGILGALVGVMLYRWGRREASGVMPVLRRHKSQREADKLLRRIEKYDGK